MPTFDNLNLNLARMIDDYPASGTPSGDGQRSTAAHRVDWLNHAMRDFHRSNLNFDSEEGLECSVKNAHAMRNYIQERQYVLSGGQIDLPIGVPVVTDVVYDAAFTYTVATLTITGFTGVIASHLGAEFVGTDAGGNLFKRTITSILSSSSFTINSALTNTGTSCTLGYILPIVTGFTGGIAGILSCWNVTTGTPILPLGGDKEAVIRSAGYGSYIKPSSACQYYMIQDGAFVLVASASGNLTDNVVIMSVAPYIDLVIGGTILFPIEYHTQILADAYKLSCIEDPSDKNITRLKALSGG
jgi:hypothetical protein